MTSQTLEEILAGVDQQAQPQPLEKPNLRPRVIRQGPSGKTPKSADPLSLDGDSSETDSKPTTSRSRVRPGSTTRTLPTSSATPPSDEEVGEIEATLAFMLLMGGGVVGMALPVTGTTLVMRSQVGAHAIVTAARTNPKIWKRLVAFVKVTKWTDVVQFAGNVVVAASVDMHVMNPNSTLPQMMIPDVLERFKQTAEDQPGEPTQNGTGPVYAGSVFASSPDSNGGVASGGPV